MSDKIIASVEVSFSNNSFTLKKDFTQVSSTVIADWIRASVIAFSANPGITIRESSDKSPHNSMVE